MSVPGGHSASIAAVAAVMAFQSSSRSQSKSMGNTGKPPRWVSTWRSVQAALPPSANCGQAAAIG